MWKKVTTVAICCILGIIWRFTGRPKGLPPGPTCYPIIGNVGLFKPSEAVKANRRLRKQYGDIYTIMFFHKPIITVHGYDNIRELMVKNVDMFLDRPITIINGVFNKGKGLMWSSGSLWEEQRKFALATLSKMGFGKRCLQGQIMEEVDCLMDEVEKFENQPFDIHHTLNTAVSNVICSLLFGKRFDHEDAKFKNLIKLLDKMFATTNPSSPAFVFPLLRFLPGSGFHNMEKIFGDIDEFTEEIIKEHKKKFEENQMNNFVDGFLTKQTHDGNSTFTDKQLIIIVREFFGAGTETTSTTLRWALLFLIHHREWQKDLRGDVETLIGKNQPTMENKENLPRIEAFILEVQRHANLAPFGIPHTPREDFIYNGYLLPKGTCINFALDSVMMDSEIFPDPFVFKPERFLDENGKCQGEQKDKLIPFSIGKRSCLGESLAKMELFLFLTRFLQRFEIKPENPERLPTLEPILGLTNMPKDFKIDFVKR